MPAWFNYPEFDWPEKHAIIIGAGIAGCQMTWHLSRLGWRVTLIEQERHISTKASGNLAGVISPKMTAQDSDGERFYRAAFHYATQQLSHFGWQPCGMLQLAHNDREQRRWASLKQRIFDTTFLQLVSPNEASNIAGIRCDYPASYFPQAGFIHPATFCHDLLAHSNHHLICARKVTKLQRCHLNNMWEVLDETEQCIQKAPVIILCNGIDISGFSVSQFIPQMPVLGQTSHMPSSTISGINCVIGHEGYLIPAYQGINVFGATFDREFDCITTTEQANQRNLSQLKRYLPALERQIQTVTSGHAAARSTTPDRYPYAGAIPDINYYQQHYQPLKHGRPHQHYPDAKYQNGLFVLGGFGSRGLTTSAYCANALSQLIANQHNTLEQHHNAQLLNTLHPARFLIRQLKRGQDIT
ncbi:MAG: hypothetical protein CSB47_00550 [Proteobacteria bacterium]|nr:MAG: hypothetical protein CSB47_00550 [Pseudomonadota bacterium]